MHAPDTMDFYRDHPARKWVLSLPTVKLPPLAEHPDPPCPLTTPIKGPTPANHLEPPLDAPEPGYRDRRRGRDQRGWPRALEHHRCPGIRNLLYAGVHTNTHPPPALAIKQTVRWGLNVALARDLTDAMYNPMRPLT